MASSEPLLSRQLDEFQRCPENVDYVSTEIKYLLNKCKTRRRFANTVTQMLDSCFNTGPQMQQNYANLFSQIYEIVISDENSRLFRVKDAMLDVLLKNVEITQQGFSIFQKRLSFVHECLNLHVVTPNEVFKPLMLAASQKSDNNELALRFQFEVLRIVSALVDNCVVAWNGKPTEELNLEQVVSRLKEAISKNILLDRPMVGEINTLLNHLKEKKRWYPNEMPHLEAGQVVDLTLIPSPLTSSSRQQRPSSNRTVAPSSAVPLRTREIDLSSHFVQIHRSRPTQLRPRLSMPELPPPLLPSPQTANRTTGPQQPQQLARSLNMPSVSLQSPQSQQPPQQSPVLSPGRRQLLPINFKSLITNLTQHPDSLAAITKEVTSILVKEPATRQSFFTNTTQLVEAILAEITTNSASLSICANLIGNLKNFEFAPFGGPRVTFRESLKKIVVTANQFTSMLQCVNFCATLPLTKELYQLDLVPRDVFSFYVKEAKEDNEIAAYLILEVVRNLDSLVDAHIAQLTEDELQFWDGVVVERLTRLLRNNVFEATLSGNITAFLDSLHEKGGFSRKICHCKEEPKVPVAQPMETTVPTPSPVTVTPRILDIVTTVTTTTTSTPVQPLTLQTNVTGSSITHVTPSYRPASLPVVSAQHPPAQQAPSTASPAVRSQLLLTATTSTRHASISQQKNDYFLLIKSITALENSENWVNQVKTQLKATTNPFAFTNATSLLFVKVFELVNEEALEEVTNICIDLCKTDFGRGRCFSGELEQFSIKYVCGKNKADFDRAKQAVETDSDRAETLSQLLCPPLEEEEKTLSEDLAVLEELFLRRRIGCVRLVGRLFTMKQFDLKMIIAFSDALLSTASEQSLECLLELLGDIGNSLPPLISAEKKDKWFADFFQELVSLGQNANSSEKLKKLVNDIILEKNSWRSPDPKAEARRKLKQLLDGLTPELARTPSSCKQQLHQIRDLIHSEFPDEHTRKCFNLYQDKVYKVLFKSSNSLSPTGSSSSPRPQSSASSHGGNPRHQQASDNSSANNNNNRKRSAGYVASTSGTASKKPSSSVLRHLSFTT